MATESGSSSFVYDIAGQHAYKGITYLKWQPVEMLDSLPDFEFSAEDVVVATYPKCGTTWMCELADVIHHNGDTQKAQRAPINVRWPFLEMSRPGFNPIEVLNATAPPRLIKTHMEVSFFERQVREQDVKTLVVLRNPKDALVSYYHFYRMNSVFDHFEGTWDQFFEIYKAGQINYGDPLTHMLGWWQLKDLPNVEVFMYEDMLRDPKKAAQRVAMFLGKSFTDEKIDEIVKFTSFDNMKKNPAANYSNSKAMTHSISSFLRKGEAGDWKNYFSEEQSKYVDDMIEKTLDGSGITFTFE